MSARKLVYTALLAALTAVGAFIRIPIGISVITLQFLFTAMAGVLLGPGGGALSQGVYVALGLVGLPIFTAGGGFGYVLQPSFGFLLGLIPAAAVIGGLSRRSSSPVRLALACGAGRGIHSLFDGEVDAAVLVNADDLDLDLLPFLEMILHIVDIGIGDL